MIDTFIEKVKFDAHGLVTAVAVHNQSKDVVMLAYMNKETLRQTLETGVMTYWSRSRKKVWLKGETSGNTQKVESVRIDCDGDALLFTVEPQGIGAACHEGYRSCFFRKWNGEGFDICDERLEDPETMYGKKQ